MSGFKHKKVFRLLLGLTLVLGLSACPVGGGDDDEGGVGNFGGEREDDD